MQKVLVIAAHPDDEVLGCGGTMARLASEGKEVYSLILGEGITSRDEKRDRAKREPEIQKLLAACKSANKLLNVKEVINFDLPDNRFDSVDLLDIIKLIERVKKEVVPDIVFTHFEGDLNNDHQITVKAVMAAFRPVPGQRVSYIYSFPIPSATGWNVASQQNNFLPNYFVNIEQTIDLKVKSLLEYESEVLEFPHPRSPEAIRAIASGWGINVGMKYAEAFSLIRGLTY